MKQPVIVTGIVILFLAAGCADMQSEVDQGGEIDAWLASSVHETEINNAIIAQHTLFPYHFVHNAAQLNELGERDMGVLASHFRTHPGALNIRRGDAGDELHLARVKAVERRLARARIDANRIAISDALPGGGGMPSEHVLIILYEQSEQRAPSPAASVGDATRGVEP